MDGLQKDTLELIQKTAQEAGGSTNKVVVVNLPGRFQPTHLIIKPDGTYEEVDGDIPIKEIRLHHLGGVATFVDQLLTRDEKLVSPCVWYNEAGVFVEFDGRLKKNTDSSAFYKLAETVAYYNLIRLDGKRFSQKQMIQLLENQFTDNLADYGDQLLSALRSVDFRNDSTTSGAVENGRESLGIDIQKEVKSKAGDIPEMIVIRTRLFDDPSLVIERDIRCLVDINPSDLSFGLLPVEDDLKMALYEELENIGSILGKDLPETVPLCRGHVTK